MAGHPRKQIVKEECIPYRHRKDFLNDLAEVLKDDYQADLTNPELEIVAMNFDNLLRSFL